MSVPQPSPFPPFSVCPPPKVNAPPYIIMHKGKPRMRFGVLNRSKLVTPELLCRILHAIKVQVKKDFAPYYGIDVSFTVFSDNTQPDWRNFVPLIFVDFLIPSPAVSGAVAFHAVQVASLTSPDAVGGNAISTFITNPPNIPDGLPYAIIPMGDANTDYGVYFEFLQQNPGEPPTFAGILTFAVSHEVLETLGDQTTNSFISDFGTANTFSQFELNIMEVCDPVEFGPSYPSPVEPDLYLSNFVLPSYWNPYGQTFAPFDFLHRVLAPLTPFQGEQDIILITNRCVITNATKKSPVDDPTHVFITIGKPIFPPKDSKTSAETFSKNNLKIHRQHPRPKGSASSASSASPEKK